MSRIVAIDYGRRRIGVAASDPLGITVQPHKALRVNDTAHAVGSVANVLKELEASEVVLGLPLDQYGREGPMAAEVRSFGEKLAERTGVPVRYSDERFTSKQAERAIHEMGLKTGKDKSRTDSLSAVFILQGYLGTGM